MAGAVFASDKGSDPCDPRWSLTMNAPQQPPAPPKPTEDSRVDRSVEELAGIRPNGRELAGEMAGTSQETAALFASRHVVP
jgi:hypothetical protein